MASVQVQNIATNAAAGAGPPPPPKPNSNQKPEKLRAKRSRTGCKTCRQRKLKCDERRPVCSQCEKSNRTCVPADAVAFRHHQNATLRGQTQSNAANALGSFYRDAPSFSQDQLRGFLPITAPLTWVHISDAAASTADSSSPEPAPNASAYQPAHVAAHSLEALSAAAADHTTFGPPAQQFYTETHPVTDAHPEYTLIRPASGDQTATHAHLQSLAMATGAARTPDNVIDPSLEASIAQGPSQVDDETLTGHNVPVQKVEEGEHQHSSDAGDLSALAQYNAT